MNTVNMNMALIAAVALLAAASHLVAVEAASTIGPYLTENGYTGTASAGKRLSATHRTEAAMNYPGAKESLTLNPDDSALDFFSPALVTFYE